MVGIGSAGIKDDGEVGCTSDKGTSGAREHRRGLSVRGTYGAGVTGPIGRRSKRTAECEIGMIIRVRRGCARIIRVRLPTSYSILVTGSTFVENAHTSKGKWLLNLKVSQ
jgi:hypothetical protein